MPSSWGGFRATWMPKCLHEHQTVMVCWNSCYSATVGKLWMERAAEAGRVWCVKSPDCTCPSASQQLPDQSWKCQIVDRRHNRTASRAFENVFGKWLVAQKACRASMYLMPSSCKFLVFEAVSAIRNTMKMIMTIFSIRFTATTSITARTLRRRRRKEEQQLE